MNAKPYALLALLAMATLPLNANALMVQSTCTSDILNEALFEEASASVQGPAAIDEPASESTATTRKFSCGGGGGGGDGGDPDPDAWVEYVEKLIGDEVGNLDDLVPEECKFDAIATLQPFDLPRLPQQSSDLGGVCQTVKDTETPPTPPPAGHDCKEEEDDNGFGGTHVQCEYDCQVGDQLGIYVEAHDVTYGTAEADGHTECGNTHADCNIHPSKNVCTGASGKPATQNEVEAECYGESHETFDDPVTVACYSVGRDTICDLVPQLPTCNPGSNSQAMHDCLVARPEIVGDERAADLMGLIPRELASSFVAFTFTDTAGFAIGSTLLESGNVTCWGGPFALS